MENYYFLNDFVENNHDEKNKDYIAKLTLLLGTLDEQKIRADEQLELARKGPDPQIAFTKGFNVELTPDDYIKQWISKELRKANINRNYDPDMDKLEIHYSMVGHRPAVVHNNTDVIPIRTEYHTVGKRSIGINNRAPVVGNTSTTDFIVHVESWSLPYYLKRQWVANKKEQEWHSLKAVYPPEYNEGFKAQGVRMNAH